MENKKYIIEYGYYSEIGLDTDIIFSRLYWYFYNEFIIYKDNTYSDKIGLIASAIASQSILETGNYQKILLIKRYYDKDLKVWKSVNLKSKNLFNIKYGSKYPDLKSFYRIYKYYCSSVLDVARLLSKLDFYRIEIESFLKGEKTFEDSFKKIYSYYAEDKKYFDKVYNIMTNKIFHLRKREDLPYCPGIEIITL